MSNTLTDLIPDLYVALDRISRELTGLIPSVTFDAQSATAAVGQTVRLPVSPAATAEDIVPGTNAPDTGDQEIGNTTLEITKARAVPFRWTGEQQRGLNNGGPGYLSIRQMQIVQAMRTLVNELEADIGALYYRSSRAFGTAGTTPFGGKLIDDVADVMKILEDNGAPMGDVSLVLGTKASTAMKKIPNLYKVNEAGESAFLRQGIFADLFGAQVRNSAGIQRHTAGTANAGWDSNGAQVVGATAIDVDTGTGASVKGDVVTFAGDGNQYVVGADQAAGIVTLNKPGLIDPLADNVDLSFAGAYEANMLFARSAIIVAARPPATPEEGDAAIDSMMITDERTGLTFEVRMYPEYRRMRYEVCLAWGMANIKPEHSANLLG